MQVPPIDAHRFLGQLFEMTSRRVILKHSTVRQSGRRVLMLPTIAHLIRANYRLQYGVSLTGIDAFVTKTTLTITLTGTIQSWASRNCARCDSSHSQYPFQRVGEEKAITAEIKLSDLKECLQAYLGDTCGPIKLGPKTADRFFAHLSGILPMHDKIAAVVYAEIEAMKQSL